MILTTWRICKISKSTTDKKPGHYAQYIIISLKETGDKIIWTRLEYSFLETIYQLGHLLEMPVYYIRNLVRTEDMYRNAGFQTPI